MDPTPHCHGPVHKVICLFPSHSASKNSRVCPISTYSTEQTRFCRSRDFAMHPGPLPVYQSVNWGHLRCSQNEALGPKHAHSHTYLQPACAAWPLSLCWRGLWELPRGPRMATQKLLAISLMHWLGKEWLQQRERLALGPSGTQPPSLKNLWAHPLSETGRAEGGKCEGLTKGEKRKIQVFKGQFCYKSSNNTIGMKNTF